MPPAREHEVKGDLFFIFPVIYSTLLYLPPLRTAVGGC
jgi:hypothetical protein